MRHYLFILLVSVPILGMRSGTGEAQTPDLYDTTQVRSLYLTFKQVDYWQQLRTNHATQTDIKADLTVDGQTYPDIGVRFKGHASYRGDVDKEPFNLSIDEFNSNQRLYGYRTLNLNNGFLDPTFVREVVSFELLRRYLPAARANFVKLYINQVYWGVYINIQQPNTDFLQEVFGESGGPNFKADPLKSGPQASALQWLGSTPALYQTSYQLKSGNEQTAWPALADLIDKLNNTSTAQLPAVLPTVLNVDRALWYLALVNVFCNLDSYIGSGHNYYLYQRENAGTFQVVPWDVNENLGVFNLGMTLIQLQQLSPTYGSTSFLDRPLVARLLSVPAWRARYVAHMRTILNETFHWAAFDALVTRYQNLIQNDVAADTKKLYSTAYFSQAVTQDLVLDQQLVPGMKPFIEARSAYLAAHPDINQTVPTITQVSHSPASPTSLDTVRVVATITAATSVASAEVVHTGGTATLYDDGQHHDGLPNDGVFGGAIPPAGPGQTVDYHIQATAQGGGMALDPPRAAYVTYRYTVNPPQGVSPVQIHEFLAKNNTGIQDEKGEYEDWIELVNTGATSVNLAGTYLTDKLGLPTKWMFPAGTTILPGQTLLVWADEEENEGPLHASFKLSADGESIHFFDRDGQTRFDTVTFGVQQADVSTGRLVGYPHVWATFPVPSPRALNQPEPCGHREYRGLDPTTSRFSLLGQGTPQVGGTAAFGVTNAPASTPGYLALAFAPLVADLGSLGPLLVHPGMMVLLPMSTDSSGSATPSVPIPAVGALAGMTFYFQSLVLAGTSGGLSNGVMTRVCP